MASRPRRAAAQKANSAITDMVDSDNIISSKTGKIMSSRAQSRRSDAKLPASKLRQSTTSRNGQSGGRESFDGGEILAGKRNRSQKKSYVVESSDDDEAADGEDEDAEAEDDTMDLGDDDAEGDVVDDSMDLDVDAEGEDDDDLSDEDAEGEEDDMTLDATPRAPSSKASKPAASKAAASKTKSAAKPALKQDVADDNSELSELDSDDEDIQEDTTIGVGDVDEDEDEDEDAEGEDDEEIEATGAAAQGADGELLSDDDGSRAASPDFAKMTKRQRARFEDDDGTLLKLSDEVQAKKHFTAEELSMRRAEMARRRRNLSEKRNEEVKRETIDKLLKKQAPKTNRKAQLAAEEAALLEEKPNPVFVRWVSNKDGERVGVPDEIMAGPAGKVFVPGGLKSGKMVEEVN